MRVWNKVINLNFFKLILKTAKIQGASAILFVAKV